MDTEVTHALYSLRTALACILATLPPEQRRQIASRMAQHLVLIEESAGMGMEGAPALLAVMEETFLSLNRAAALQPTFF